MAYQHIQVPETGEMIVVNDDNSLSVPNNPIIPYIEGDGIGVDISPVMIAVVDAAVYPGLRPDGAELVQAAVQLVRVRAAPPSRWPGAGRLPQEL